MNITLGSGAYTALAKRILWPLATDTGGTLLDFAREQGQPMSFKLVDAEGVIGHALLVEPREHTIFVRFVVERTSWTPRVQVFVGDDPLMTFHAHGRDVHRTDTVDFEWYFRDTRVERA